MRVILVRAPHAVQQQATSLRNDVTKAVTLSWGSELGQTAIKSMKVTMKESMHALNTFQVYAEPLE